VSFGRGLGAERHWVEELAIEGVCDGGEEEGGESGEDEPDDDGDGVAGPIAVAD